MGFWGLQLCGGLVSLVCDVILDLFILVLVCGGLGFAFGCVVFCFVGWGNLVDGGAARCGLVVAAFWFLGWCLFA